MGRSSLRLTALPHLCLAAVGSELPSPPMVARQAKGPRDAERMGWRKLPIPCTMRVRPGLPAWGFPSCSEAAEYLWGGGVGQPGRVSGTAGGS